ncbi:MAG: hypothetical protein K8J08_08000, partial [Thermoanaerobaculia bacterium]|nr:hypothetical protein [Thermoanaerobaculia bacterium]
ANGEDSTALAALDAVRTELTDADRLLLDASGFWESEFQQDRFLMVANRVEQTNLQIQHANHRLDQLVAQGDSDVQVQHRAEDMSPLVARLEAQEAFHSTLTEGLSLLPVVHKSTSTVASELADFADEVRQLRRDITTKVDHEVQRRELELARDQLARTLDERDEARLRAKESQEAQVEIQRQWNQTTSELESQRVLKASLESQVAATESEVQTVQKSLDAARYQIAQGRRSEDSLRQQLTALQSERDRIAHDCNAAEIKLAELRARLSWRTMEPFRRLRGLFSRHSKKE